jgi:hypothetical protein
MKTYQRSKMTNYMKKLLAIREVQIKTKIRYHLTPVRKAVLKKQIVVRMKRKRSSFIHDG